MSDHLRFGFPALAARGVRRPFLALLFIAAWSSAVVRADELRVMSYNIWVGLNEADELNRQVELIQATGADIIGLQEQNGAARLLAGELEFYYHALGSSTAVLSRFPITESFDDGVGLDLGDGHAAYLFDVHLAAFPYQPYDLRDGLISTEAQAIAGARATRGNRIAGVLSQMSAPLATTSPAFLVGDFNEPSHLDWTQPAADAALHPIKVAWPTSTAVVSAGLTDSYRQIHPDPVARPGDTWTPRPEAGEIHDRIDRVYYAGADLTPIASQLVGEAGGRDVDIAAAGVFPSDHRAVVSTFSLPYAIPEPPKPEPLPPPMPVEFHWNFDGGDLSIDRQVGGTAVMSYFNDGARTVTTFGNTSTNPNVADMPDGPGNFLHHTPFPDGGAGGYGVDYTGVVGNAGGGFVNEYTMVFDVFIPDLASWSAMFNTNSGHANDADWYVDPAGRLGIGALGYTDDAVISPSTWHRIGIVLDGDDNFVRYYVDGEKVFDRANQASIDGRFSLYTEDHDGFDLIVQGEGDTSGNYSNEVYLGAYFFANSALDDDTMKSLGGVSAQGIVLASLLGDITDNGFVDFEDLTVLLANWNKDVGADGGNLVDPLTTVVNFEDLTVLLAAWTGPGPAGAPEAALGAEAVPEPTSLLLAMLGLLGMLLTSRRRRRA
ncbi:MAG: endonuclease/exonuclease/phosphatase family protein [Planctomycetes bacterium]|nr:endonuclease/exonuclease/phosphatase family protein [Planctomycetota bacterium]